MLESNSSVKRADFTVSGSRVSDSVNVERFCDYKNIFAFIHRNMCEGLGSYNLL